MRTFGVEEELLLIDESTGAPVPVARKVLDEHRAPRSGALPDEQQMTGELQQEMIEVCTTPQRELGELAEAIRAGRAFADATAQTAGARAVPLATSPLLVQPHLMPKLRYLQMRRRYGMTTRNSLTCGMHVHVAVKDDSEGVAVLDRIRAWVPVLLALSANSPFWQGEDTGHASYRYAAWLRWPTAGPTELFGTAENYARLEAEMAATGALLDSKMIYFDARLSRSHPTVEVRIADVCLTPEHATLIAALTRALVETAAREWRAGVPPVPAAAPTLRVASWQAALAGVRGDLVNPLTGRARPAADVVAALLEHVAPVLRELGEADEVAALAADVLDHGTGAERQRAVFARSRRLADVVADAIATGCPGPHLLQA
ncbi:glutamate--cysteine ligase [Naasia sp. SYSU D00057]|uniref:carboxylate-amine ligase n=1 Tax=Naasia sp. SYSU D00057 TaxID=2817380 RepID=UPI001B305BF1|nr:glutamate--cysteine ligase [Naasia sp. SYSU D00057]